MENNNLVNLDLVKFCEVTLPGVNLFQPAVPYATKAKSGEK